MKDQRLKTAVIGFSGVLAIALLILHFSAPRKDRATAEQLYQQAQSLLREGKLYEAESRLERALHLMPDEPDYVALLAEVFTRQGDYPNAVKQYLILGESRSDAVDPLLQAGILTLKTGDRERAEDILRQALEREPGNLQVLYQLGFIAVTRGRYDDARKIYDRIISLSFREPEAYRNLGFIFTEKENLAEAEKMYRKAIEYGGTDPELWNDLGNLMMIKQDFAAAREAFAKALQLKPDYPDAKSNLGWAERELARGGKPAAPAPGAAAPEPQPGSSA